jgi:hypothetical protein
MRSGKDKDGKVYPADWKQGGNTTKMDATALLEYLTAVHDARENGKVNGTKRTRLQGALEHK